MSIMNQDITLRAEPNGKREAVIAREGSEVEALGTQDVDVIGGGKDSWTKVQLVDADGVPQGWVPSATIDLAGAPSPDGPIGLPRFARQCWWDRMIYDVNPYYLTAVAQLRSKVSGGQDKDGVGPFRLTQAEWNAGRTDTGFDLGTFREKDIADWRMQCVLFAQMANRAEDSLTHALGRQPNWVELYLAQIIGPSAAAAVIKSPDGTIDTAFRDIKADELPAGGLTPAQLVDRYANLLRDTAGPVTGHVALDRIGAGLQAALEEVRGAVDEVANEILGGQPNEDDVKNAKDSLPSKSQAPISPPPVTTGESPPSVPGAGGTLGELIAAHESGKAGYSAYNRGNAGDSGIPRINFSQMTIQSIMALQSLRPGNPNRLFAVGKYQIIPLTMKDAVRKLNINANEKLTNQLQEHLFRNYLIAIKRPNVKAFIIGKNNVNIIDAQLALALEFASVGDPTRNGRSHYAGSAGNKASITLNQTKIALQKEAALYQQFLSGGKSADEAWSALSPGISPLTS